MEPEPAFAYRYYQYVPSTDTITTINLPEPKTVIQFCFMLSKLNFNVRDYGVVYFSTEKSFIKNEPTS